MSDKKTNVNLHGISVALEEQGEGRLLQISVPSGLAWAKQLRKLLEVEFDSKFNADFEHNDDFTLLHDINKPIEVDSRKKTLDFIEAERRLNVLRLKYASAAKLESEAKNY